MHHKEQTETVTQTENTLTAARWEGLGDGVEEVMDREAQLGSYGTVTGTLKAAQGVELVHYCSNCGVPGGCRTMGGSLCKGRMCV